MIVGGGVVLAASYEARAHGIRTPMNARQALRLCPHAVVVPPRMSAYARASRAVFEIFRDTTPEVEGISIDEAFLEVGGLLRIAGSPVRIARTLRERVRAEVGLPISVGVARTKFLAKVASAVSKPDGLLEVPPGGELDFLHPLPVERLWGVGEVTARTLHDHGITRIGQLAELGEKGLSGLLGPAAGRHLYALSWARDPRRVDTAADAVPSAHSARWAGAPAPPRRSKPTCPVSPIGSATASARPIAYAGQWCCACDSTISPAPPAPIPSPRPPITAASSTGPHTPCSPPPCP